MFYFLLLVFFSHYAESLADEKKTITPKEFAQNISEVPNKVGNFLTNEVEKTKHIKQKFWARNYEEMARTKYLKG